MENTKYRRMKIQRSVEKKSFAVKYEIREAGQKIAWGYLYVIFHDRHREPYGLMENVYVQKEYRNRGLGGALVRSLISEAKKQKCYKLIGTSKTGNRDARRFYERFGFKKVGYEFRMDLKKSKPLQRD